MNGTNGRRLVIPRPGHRGHRSWYGYYPRHRGQAYDQWRAEQRERIRNMPHQTAGDVKQQSVRLNDLAPGEHYRLVDGHGRSFGKRLVAGKRQWALLKSQPLVRRVNRQPEDYHSQISRILKAAHRRMLREP